MKAIYLLITPALLLGAGCRKGDDCSRRDLTRAISLNSLSEQVITYNDDGTIRNAGADLSYFNHGQLMEHIGPDDTVAIDSSGMVIYMKKPFEQTLRQTRYYYYDGRGRVTRTLTYTGNGITYWAILVYEHDDVVDMVFSHYAVAPPGSSHFRYTYYDTVCVDQYLGMKHFGQIGMIRNRHLLKSASYGGHDSIHYSYTLDNDKRVLTSFRRYQDGRFDSTNYEYTCR